MAKWVLVGGDSGNEGDPYGAQIYSEGGGGIELPAPAAPAEQEYLDPQTGLYSFPDVTPAPKPVSFWDDPLNFTAVGNALALHPEWAQDPTFDFETYKSLKSRLEERNKGKMSYDWSGFTEDDPEYGLLQSLQVPQFVRDDPAYAQKYDAAGYKIPVNYDPAANTNLQDPAGRAPVTGMSPLEQTIAGLLPTGGKVLGTLGMGAQGASIAGLPGLVVGGALGLGMTSADPNAEKQTWLNQIINKANAGLNWSAEQIEGFLGYMAAGGSEAPTIKPWMSEEEKQRLLDEARKSGYQTPSDLISKMVSGTDEERAAAKEEWNKNIAAGQTFYNAALSQGLVSVPGKVASLLSRKIEAHDPVGETATEEAKRLGSQLMESITEAYERRQEIWGFEGSEGWQPPEGEWAAEAAFADAKKLIEQGVAPREAVEQINQRFGLGGVTADLVGQAVLDPLNLVGVGLLKGAGLLGKGAKALKVIEATSDAGRFLSKAVSKLSGGLSDDFASPQFSKAMAESRDVLELARNMGLEVRQSGAQNASRMSRVTRTLAGVDDTGNYKRFIVPGDPEHMSILQRMGNSMLFATKEARASEMLSHITQGLANNIGAMDNADDVVKMLDQLASMSPSDAVRASESGKLTGWVDNVMSQSAPAAVKDTLPKIRAMAATFQDSRRQATALSDLANALGTTPRKLVNDLANRTDDKVQAFWTRAIQELGEDNAALRQFKNGADLKAQAQLFVPGKGRTSGALPLTLEEFKASSLNLLAKGVADFSTNYFGVKPYGWAWQISMTIKKAQGLLLLGFNPGYFMNNGINNAITLAYDGLFSVPELLKADSFLARWGDEVVKLEQGNRVEMVTGKMSDAESVIRNALRPGGKFGKVQNGLDSANRSKLAFATTISNNLEQASSKMAMVVALKDTARRLMKVGVGIDDLPADMARALDDLQPGLSNKVRRAIENSLNTKELQANIFDDLDSVTLRDIIPDESYSMLDVVPGLTDSLNARLKTASTSQDIMDAFSVARKQLTDYAEGVAVEAAQEWAEHAAMVARAEGVHSVLNMMDEMGDYKRDVHISHFKAMDLAAERAVQVEGKELKSIIWTQARGQSQAAWARYRKQEKARMVGIARGLGATSEQALAITDRLDEIGKIWDDFYKTIDDLNAKHAEAQYATPVMENEAWRRIQARIDKAYTRAHAAEVDAQRAVDAAFADMMEAQFPGSRQAALDWRQQIAEASELQYRTMAYFRGAEDGAKLPGDVRQKVNSILGGQELNDMDAETRQTVWTNFINEVYEPMIIDRTLNARKANQEMLANAGRQQPVSPEEIEAVRAARSQARQRRGELDELDERLAEIDEEITLLRNVLNPLDKVDDEGMPIPVDMEVQSQAAARMQEVMIEREQLTAQRAQYSDIEPEGPAPDMTPAEMRAEVFNILNQVQAYKGNVIHMRRSAAKYLGREVKDISDLTPDEAMLVIQRRAAAEQLGMKGRDVAKRLEAIERELDIRTTAEPGAANAVHAPVGLVDRHMPLPPYKEAVLQGMDNMFEALNMAERGAVNTPRRNYTQTMQQMPEELRAQFNQYLSQTERQMSEVKNTATKIAESRRNFALLDYNDRYGLDNYVGAALPYQFWYSRSMKNWMLRAMTRPQILHRYALLSEAGNSIPQDSVPTRLRGKIKIPIQFMDDELGDGIYVDVNRQIFPFVQIWKAFNQVAEDQNMLSQRTVSILQDMAERQDITAEQLREAMADHNSDLYKEAEAEARTQVDLDIRNSADFIGAMSGWSLPIQWALNAKDPERISQLPIAKTIENVSYMLGRGFGAKQGVDIEQPIRRAVGLPEETKYEPMYVNRALAAMASDAQVNGGRIKNLEGKWINVTPDDFRRAEIDREGELYDIALRRVNDMGLVKWLGSSVGADFYQQGEERQRRIKEEYGMAMATDDPDAYKKFINAYPEYKVQQDAWKPADDRMRNYLKDLVWTTYYEMPRAKQQDFAEQMGDQFKLLFLNKETRNYAAIDTETLSMWAKTMGAELPKAAGNVPGASVKWTDPDTVKAMSEYYELESQQFPGLKELMADLKYWDKSFEEQEQIALANPEIMVYNVWRDNYLASHPNLIQRMISKSNVVYGKSVEVQAAYYNKKAMTHQFFPNIQQIQNEYFKYPEKSAERKAVLAKYPQLKQYWNWSEQYDKAYLPMSVEWQSESKIMKAYGVQPQTYKPGEVLNSMSEELSGRVVQYLALGTPLSAAARAELELLRNRYAKGKTLDEFLAELADELVTK